MVYVIKFAKLEVFQGIQRMECVRKLDRSLIDITSRQKEKQMLSDAKAGCGNVQ